MLDQFTQEALRGKSETTIRTYTHALKQFEEWLEGTGANLSTFARSDVQQYIDYLTAKKMSAATINKIWNAIKKYCKWAGMTDAIEDISVVKPVDYTQQAPQSLTRKERLALLREVDRTGNRRDIAIVNTLLYTGIRVGELVALDRTDVEISERKGTLYVRSGKGNKARSIPLNVEARRAIAKYLGERTDDHPALFLSNRMKRISVRTVQHIVEQYGYHVHQLRHTFITGLVRAGEDISVIRSLSGHSSADMILRYSRPSEQDREKAVESIYHEA